MGDSSGLLTAIIWGLDGASLKFVELVMKRVDLPNFQRVLEGGVSSEMRSIHPYVTAPNWASMFSGVNPGKHGLFDMVEYDGSNVRIPNMAGSEVPYLWDYLSWAGKRVLTMGVPFMHPAPAVNGIFVTGRFVPKLSCFPEALATSMDLSGYDYRAIHDSLKTSRMTVLEDVLIDSLRKRIDASLALLNAQPWDVVLLVDSLPDEILHRRYNDTEVIHLMFKVLDGWLGELLRLMKQSDFLMIVSDHGFGDVTRTFYLNEWLRQKGYVESPRRVSTESDKTHEMPVLKRLFKPKLNNSTASAPGQTPEHYERELIRIQRELDKRSPRWRGHSSSKVQVLRSASGEAWIRILTSGALSKVIESSLIRESEPLKQKGFVADLLRSSDLYDGKFIGKVPGQLLVAPAENVAIDLGESNQKELIVDTQRRGGGHESKGLLVFYGTQKGSFDHVPHVCDIAPTLLDHLKLPIADFIDGKVLKLVGSNEP
jgi:predicted AlkP superfamily phosphohydrolase/phosphomutase